MNNDVTLGLSDQEVAKLQQKHGKNILASHDITSWHILTRQLSSPFFFLLVAAALLSIFLKDFLSSGMIIIFISINTILGFYQEYNAENTIKLLQHMIVSKITVRRNGVDQEIPVSELVPGDVILLEPGDIVPADLRFIQTEDVTIDEAALTGESALISKTHIAQNQDDESTKHTVLGFCGTVMVTGRATAVVTAIGMKTVLGSIAQASFQIKREGIFTRDLHHFGPVLFGMMGVTLSSVFLLHYIIRGSTVQITDLILFVLALTVSIIPEALPVVVSFCLARGALRMATKHVVVRRLSAIQDLGGIDVLCADKTGTLTENNLEVIEVWGDEPEVIGYALVANRFTDIDRQIQVAHSFDAAICKKAQSISNVTDAGKRVVYRPFDPLSLCSYAYVENLSQYTLIVRGAYERVIEKCGQSSSLASALFWAQEQGVLGRRVIAIAVKEYGTPLEADQLVHQSDFELLGMIAFQDPIKSTAITSIKRAQSLGITIKILTGDAPEVAGAVALNIGLIHQSNEVMTGAQLDALSEIEREQAVEDCHVFARVTPLEKHAIIKQLQNRHKVGFLGEGINDAPALKCAHVAIVVENGSDIAKDVADIILLKQSLRAIIDGIEEGRRALLNTVKYIRVTLTSNFSNFYTIALISLYMDFLPMLPLQILFVNILSDFPLIAIALDTVDYYDLKKPQQFSFVDIVRNAVVWSVFCSVFDIVFFGFFFKRPESLFQTMWFMFSILTELCFFYVIRTKKLIIRDGVPSKPLAALTFIVGSLALLIPLTVIGQKIFKFAPPGCHDYMFLFAVLGCFVIVFEIIKYFLYHKNSV